MPIPAFSHAPGKDLGAPFQKQYNPSIVLFAHRAENLSSLRPNGPELNPASPACEPNSIGSRGPSRPNQSHLENVTGQFNRVLSARGAQAIGLGLPAQRDQSSPPDHARIFNRLQVPPGGEAIGDLRRAWPC